MTIDMQASEHALRQSPQSSVTRKTLAAFSNKKIPGVLNPQRVRNG
jgi:hypothetical protein